MANALPATDQMFMHRALTLAARGRGAVEPNPLVGCVIVREGRTIGEGFHRKFGQPHAEAEALAACTESPEGATAYVTLEPCCHTNKKTPPCVPRLIEARIARVVVACIDPNPQVAGKGIEELRAAGIEVTVGLLQPEAGQLNAPFFALVQHHRPYVTLKWAQTSDGKVAAPPGAPRLMISNRASRKIVQQLRARCDAIMVGINTVVADNPLLTVRGVEPMRPLTRLVLDRHLRTPLTSRLVQTALHTPTVVYCHRPRAERAAEFKMCGVEVVDMPTDQQGDLALADILHWLGDRNCTHLLVEPGPRLAGSFLEAGLADRLWLTRSPHQASDPDSLGAPTVDYPSVAEADVEGDHLAEYLNPRSKVFFRPQPSPDFQQLSRRQ
jgi:diaminohydroxyphosphoribosylaminopyrimidine deaminase/5-amino-6-(5-phosphoribosylamino)uracil reductase